MYKYWAFGLHILSEIVFPEFLPFEFETPDVTIRLGKTPEILEGANVIHRVLTSMNDTEYLLKLINIANYYVTHGNKVTVEPLTSDSKSVRLFLLSNVMAAVLHQRNLIPLHASGIFCKGGVALFCGESGMGKSTLITALQQQGHAIFTDDVCVLQTQENGETKVVASYPMIKLWEDSFAKTGLEMANEADRIRPQLPKYARYYHGSFTTVALPVKSIFILNRSAHITEPELKPLAPMRAFAEIQKNTYRPLQMNAMQKRNVHFTAIAKLTASSTAYQVIRPEYHNSLEKLTSLIKIYL